MRQPTPCVSSEEPASYGDMTTVDSGCCRYDEITGGMDLLPRAFLTVLQEPVLLNSKVKRIIQSNEGVTVSYQKGQQSSVTDLQADAVVVTTTARAALFIDFVPSLSVLKMKALRSGSDQSHPHLSREVLGERRNSGREERHRPIFPVELLPQPQFPRESDCGHPAC